MTADPGAAYTDADITLLLHLDAHLAQFRGPSAWNALLPVPCSVWPRRSARDEPYQFRPLGSSAGRYSRGLYLPRQQRKEAIAMTTRRTS